MQNDKKRVRTGQETLELLAASAPYKQGDRFRLGYGTGSGKYANDEYILAVVGADDSDNALMCLISVESGNHWAQFAPVRNPRYVTPEEMYTLTDGCRFQPVLSSESDKL